MILRLSLRTLCISFSLLFLVLDVVDVVVTCMEFIQNDVNDKADFETTKQIHARLCSESVPALSSEYVNPHIPRCILGVYSSFLMVYFFSGVLIRMLFGYPCILTDYKVAIKIFKEVWEVLSF